MAAMIDTDTFVKSLLGIMWMLNDLPRPMRRDIDAQLGLVWLLISDPGCYPSIEFTTAQQQAICEALERCSPPGKQFKYTYEALAQYAAELKLQWGKVPPTLLGEDDDRPLTVCPPTTTHSHSRSPPLSPSPTPQQTDGGSARRD
jgi:hypothetical protein